MLSLAFGLVAALCWGVHDVCVRFATEKTGVALALLAVLASGLVLLLPVAVMLGDWTALTRGASLRAMLAGIVYAGAGYALYRAFAIGPVRLVAPVIASYPILSVLWAAARGSWPSAGQMVAVLAIAAGVGLIAALADDGVRAPGAPGRTSGLKWSLAASLGFATTFALGQAASIEGAALPLALIARAVSVATLAGAMALSGAGFTFAQAPWRLLVIMGACDVAALTLVQSAGGLPRPEFAAVTSSIFGMVTILLAWAFLRERLSAGQWGAAGVVFAGIGYLAL